ncbi:MAG: hypothetical protein R3B54_05550 [Bdellovibrionota bacterium]
MGERQSRPWAEAVKAAKDWKGVYDQNPYVPKTNDCDDYARLLHIALEKAGIPVWTLYYQCGDKAHALVIILAEYQGKELMCAIEPQWPDPVARAVACWDPTREEKTAHP